MDAVRRNAKKIQEKYVEKGYFLAEVTTARPGAGRRQVDVVFVINEHAKVMVKEITFLGAQQVPPEELKAVMVTKEGGFLSFLTGEGTYREEAFQRDLAVIQAAYYDRGFINVKVEKPAISLSRGQALHLHHPQGRRGRAVRHRQDGLLGRPARPQGGAAGEDDLARRASASTARKLATDILALTDVYYDQGYAYANINPVTAVNAENKTIDLTFDIQKGKQVTIERIDIVGNTKTRDKVIRRELRVYEGELFNGTGHAPQQGARHRAGLLRDGGGHPEARQRRRHTWSSRWR